MFRTEFPESQAGIMAIPKSYAGKLVRTLSRSTSIDGPKLPGKMLTCYVCGQGFGSASLQNHIPHCLRKRADVVVPDRSLQTAAPRAPKQPLPGPGASAQEVARYNVEAEESYKASMPTCDKCGRKFADVDKLQLHRRGCKAQARPAPLPSKVDKGGMPHMVVCHVCGQKFGTTSLPLHIPDCYTKFKNRMKNTPAELRTRAAVAPTVPIPGPGAPMAALEAYNELAEAAYKASCPACPACSRRFMDAERLTVHMRSCKVVAPLEKKQKKKKKAEAGGKEGMPHMVVCHVCGQKFGTKSLSIHIPECYKKFHHRQEHTEPEFRTKAPVGPDMDVPGPEAPMEELEAYNAVAEAAYKASMPACAGCGRRFMDADRLQLHMSSCRVKQPAALEDKRKKREFDKAYGKEGAMPHMVVCHVCGQKFGTKSLSLHIPECYRKYENRQQNFTAPQFRLPAPEAPDMEIPGPESPMKELDAYNALAEAAYKASMPSCPKCGRRFMDAERVQVHVTTCKGPPKSKGQQLKPMQQPAKPKLVKQKSRMEELLSGPTHAGNKLEPVPSKSPLMDILEHPGFNDKISQYDNTLEQRNCDPLELSFHKLMGRSTSLSHAHFGLGG